MVSSGDAVLTQHSFERIRRLVYRTAGIDLQPGKESLVSSRLGKRLRQQGIASYDDYLERVESDKSGAALIALIDALTTNYTTFLREPAHFDFLRTVIVPALSNRKKIEIWCAAAATGEEPYSLAATMADAAGAGRTHILATDISTQALEKARRGVYHAERFAGIDPDWHARHFLRGSRGQEGYFCVKPAIAAIVEFRRLNLMEPFSHGRLFPLISCRNVMIYFDKKTQEEVVRKMADCLEPGGFLFVGHSESLNGIRHPLRFVKPAIYAKPA